MIDALKEHPLIFGIGIVIVAMLLAKRLRVEKESPGEHNPYCGCN